MREVIMATTKEFRDYVVEQLKLVDNVLCRPMMGEYLLYADGILFGGIYDGRVLIKKVSSNLKYQLEDAIPYAGAKPMYWIDHLEDMEYLKILINDTCQDLPRKKGK